MTLRITKHNFIPTPFWNMQMQIYNSIYWSTLQKKSEHHNHEIRPNKVQLIKAVQTETFERREI